VSSEPASAGVTQAAEAPAGTDTTRRFGLGTATALVIGTIIGVGIFNLPNSLSFYGPISLVSMALTTGGSTAFTTLVLMTGITASIPYAFSALAQIKWSEEDHRAGGTGRFALDMTIAVLSLVFSILFIWYSRNTGQSFWLYWAPFLLAGGALLLGIPVYMSQRARMTEHAPAPRAAGDAART
jgi:APA family basic amino acid/polyamine antiporter